MTKKPSDSIAAAAAIMAKVVVGHPRETEAAAQLAAEAEELATKFGKRGKDLFVSNIRNDAHSLYLAEVRMEVAPRYLGRVTAVVEAERTLTDPDDQTAWNLGAAFETHLSKNHRLCRNPEAARLVLALSPHADDPWLVHILSDGGYDEAWRYWGWPAGWCLSRDIIDAMVDQKKLTPNDRLTYAKAMQR